MADDGGTPPRVAIKFRTPASSNGRDTKKHARPKPTSSLGKRHRAHALNDESESEDDDEGHSTGGRHETITTYGPGGASADDHHSSRHHRRSDSPGGGRRSGRDSRSDRKSHRDGGRTAQQNGSLKEVDPADKDKPVKWGLTINSKPRQRKEDEDRPSRTEDGKDQEGQPKTADEEAMEALMAKPGDRKKRRNDTSGDPDRDPVAEDYRSVPVEDFGATLLRGFGWDGKMRGKVKEVTKHANLTGLGAKDLKGAEDLGAWSQKSNKESGGGRPRPSRLDDYRREEEKKRQRRQDRHGDSYRHDKERERDRDRDRERERDRDRDRR